MKSILLAAASLLLLFTQTNAQLTSAPDGGNRKAQVSENIGITYVTVEYSRPGVKGREGKIWGDLVHKGYADLGFGTSKNAPWRAGANENTVIEFTTPVMVEGKTVPAGKYGLFIAYDPVSSTVILSKNHTSWEASFTTKGKMLYG
nr:DUF2911 domain-containing protein [Paraflavitalea speifideiaquila]